MWGEYDFQAGQTRCLQVGPLSLWIERHEAEWRLFHQVGADLAADTTEVVEPPSHPGSDAVVERVAGKGTGPGLLVLPVLPDRPFVVRPDVPFRLLERDEITLFVTTPVWIRLLTREERPRVVAEIPTVRSSDTWFGPSAMEGQLCYASRTRARTEAGPMRARITTQVRIVNNGAEPLALERLKLPVESLSTLLVGDGLWTPAVVFTLKEGDVEVRIEKGPPDDGGARQLAGPRDPSTNVLTRAMGALLG